MAANGSGPMRLDLRRDPGQSWGFRLQGGIDFPTPLSIQNVNPGSIAERYGIMAGDAVLQINNKSSDQLEHEQAKQEIMASGNNVTLIIQRGAVKIWKPKVTPMNELRPKELNQVGGDYDNEPYIQKTSLAADKQDVQHIGSAHNRSARPFPGFGGGAQGQGAGTVPAIVNAQYNSPLNLYSTENSVDAFQTQSNILTANMQGRQGGYQPDQMGGGGGGADRPAGMRSVKAPVFDPNQHEVKQAQLMTCKVCGSLCVGVFVRIKGEPMHPECFKCCRCGVNLKNQGYFHIEGQMYCEIHAKQVAKPGPGMQAQVVYR